MRHFIVFLFISSMICESSAQLQQGWFQRMNMPGPARHRTTSITIGERGYVGLGHVNAVFDIQYKDWWEYDPGSNSWTQKANYLPGKRYHAASFTIGNKGYVGTGRDTTFANKNDFYCYDPVTNSWSAIAPLPAAGRRGAVGFSVGNYGYVGTGSNLSDFWRYNPTTNSWNQIPSYPGGAMISSVGFTIGSKGYVGTGSNGGPTATFFEYDPSLNQWFQKASLPGLPRMEAAGFALNGYGYIGTGDDFSSGNNYGDFWRFDPQSNSWAQIQDFAGSARRYMTCFTIGIRAYAGMGTNGTNFNDLWEYGNLSDVNEIGSHHSSVHLFPNPIVESATVIIDPELKITNLEFMVFDLSGRCLQVLYPQTHQFSFTPQGISKGVYFYLMNVNGHTIGTGKFIIEEC